MSQEKTIKILVMFDALLDTRLGTLQRMDPSFGEKVLNDQYYRRRSDFFEGIDKAQYDEMYRQRDLQTLQYSYLTNLVFPLKELCHSLLLQAGVVPYHQNVELIINTYPYLVPEELTQSIISALRHWIGKLPNYSVVHIPDKELSPSYIKGRFDVIYRYDYHDWLEMHTEDFTKTPLIQEEVFVPAISFTHELNDKELKEATVYGYHPIELVRLAASRYIKLEPIDVSVFSLMHPKKI